MTLVTEIKGKQQGQQEESHLAKSNATKLEITINALSEQNNKRAV